MLRSARRSVKANGSLIDWFLTGNLMTQDAKKEEGTGAAFFGTQYSLLIKEWELCNSNIGRFDNLLFIVRGWTVALATAIVGYAYSGDDPNVCYLSIVPLSLFWSVDALFKSFQRNFILRSREIERYLASEKFESDFRNQRLTMTVPSSSTKFGSGSIKQRLLRVVRSGLIRNVMISYVPTIALVLAVGIALQTDLIGPPSEAP